jgi:hypothetical protein
MKFKVIACILMLYAIIFSLVRTEVKAAYFQRLIVLMSLQT